MRVLGSRLLLRTGAETKALEPGPGISTEIGLTGHSNTMTDELIDLTTMQPSKPLRVGFKPSDLMWIVVVGGVPYLAREAFRYFFPGAQPSLTN